MTYIIQKYKIIIFVLLILGLLVSVIWFLISKPDLNKIPSRGVFVTNTLYKSVA